jgi:hypothetical protein
MKKTEFDRLQKLEAVKDAAVSAMTALDYGLYPSYAARELANLNAALRELGE